MDMTQKPSPSSLLCLLIAALIGLPSACASPGAETSNAQQPDEIQIASHEPDSCDLCELYSKARRYVVLISTPNVQGAGVVLTSDGLVATNAHVVKGSQQLIIRTYTRETLSGELIAAEPSEDLALIHVDSSEGWFPPAIESGPYPVVSHR